jgi:hypothetical protein
MMMKQQELPAMPERKNEIFSFGFQPVRDVLMNEADADGPAPDRYQQPGDER